MGRLIGLAAVAVCLAPALGCAQADPIIESTARLANTTDTIGPYRIESVILDVRRGDKVEVFYNVDNQTHFIPLVMAERAADVRGELFVGAIPGQLAGSRITYYVAVTRDGTRLVADPEGAAALPYSFLVEE